MRKKKYKPCIFTDKYIWVTLRLSKWVETASEKRLESWKSKNIPSAMSGISAKSHRSSFFCLSWWTIHWSSDFMKKSGFFATCFSHFWYSYFLARQTWWHHSNNQTRYASIQTFRAIGQIVKNPDNLNYFIWIKFKLIKPKMSVIIPHCTRKHTDTTHIWSVSV